MIVESPNQAVERMAAGGRHSQDRATRAAAIAHFSRSATLHQHSHMHLDPIRRSHKQLLASVFACAVLSVSQCASGNSVEVHVWGWNAYGQTNIPEKLKSVVSVAAGWFHTLGLRSDGTVVGFGYNGSGQINVPADLTNATAIAAGWAHSLALRDDGTIVAWGLNSAGQCNVPTSLSNVTAIAAGYEGSLAVKSDRTIVYWGAIYAPPPSDLTNVVAVASAVEHHVALRSDGTVFTWGRAGTTNVPPGLTDVVTISASGTDEGPGHSLALRRDGTVIGWGWNAYGQANVPYGLDNVVGIATGPFRSVALKSDGTIVSWGLAQFGETNAPAQFQKPIAISAGVGHNVALDRPAPELSIQLDSLAKLRIRWPANRPGWQLQHSASLIHQDWTNSSEQPIDLGLDFEVSLPPLDGPRYFRLSKEGL